MNLNTVNPGISTVSVMQDYDARGDVGAAVTGKVRGYRQAFQTHIRRKPNFLATRVRTAKPFRRNGSGDGLLQPFRELGHVTHAQPQKMPPGAAVQAGGHRDVMTLDRPKQERLVFASLAGVHVCGELMDRRNGLVHLHQLTLVPQTVQEPAQPYIRHDSSVASHLPVACSAG